MSSVTEEFRRLVNASMPFPADVISAYSRLGPVFTSGDLSKEAKISRSTAKYYVNRMADLRMISRVPHRKKYQKYANAQTFSDWLTDLIKLAIRALERGS
jgi:DNA-binding IclR family transcriptional regulator